MALKLPPASEAAAPPPKKRRGEAQVDERPAPTRKAAGSKPATSAILHVSFLESDQGKSMARRLEELENALAQRRGPDGCADPDCEFRRIVMAQRQKDKDRKAKARGKT